MDCQTERSRSLDKYGHISTPLNLTCIVFRDALLFTKGLKCINHFFPALQLTAGRCLVQFSTVDHSAVFLNRKNMKQNKLRRTNMHLKCKYVPQKCLNCLKSLF